MGLNLKIKKSSPVTVNLDMTREQADETQAFIQFVADHLSYDDWRKLAGVLKKPGVKQIALAYLKRL